MSSMGPSFRLILIALLLVPPAMFLCSPLLQRDGAYPTFQTKYFSQIIDHFNYLPESYTKFQQKYLVYDDHWGGPTSNSPIFVYAGNEGSVEKFANNTGFLMDIAPRFKAMVVFIEHRYYGDSLPFGDAKTTFSNDSTLGYLSTSQALADYAMLVVDLRKNLTCERCPVVTFGGSYGGALAAWLRLKYPHIFLGALASSAPLLIYDKLDGYCFYDTITNNFRNESMSCYNTIKDSWEAIDKIFALPDGADRIEKTFGICKGQANPYDVNQWLRSAYFGASALDYPTPSNVFNPLPAYPVKQMCKAIDDPKAGDDILVKLRGAMNIRFNFSGNVDCFNLTLGSGSPAFGFQMSKEFTPPLPLGSRKGSMFPVEDPEISKGHEHDWIITEYGGHAMTTALRNFGSNIIFFNGLRDPWSGAGVLSNISESLVAIVAPQGAHHVDLRYSTKEDPQWLVDVRGKEIEIITHWLTMYNEDLHM